MLTSAVTRNSISISVALTKLHFKLLALLLEVTFKGYGVAQLGYGVNQLGYGVAQLAERRPAVRQA